MTLSNGSSGMPTRDFACILLPTVDYDSQLLAIRSLLDQHKKDEKRCTEDIKKIDQEMLYLSGVKSQWASDDRSDMLHTSVCLHRTQHGRYRDACAFHRDDFLPSLQFGEDLLW